MKIILEGTDASGKSTLAKYLCEELNLGFFTAGGPAKDNVAALASCAVQKTSYNCVWDRVTPISRRAYQFNVISDAHRDILEGFADDLVKQDCIFIWCIGSGEHKLKDHDTEEHIKHITDNETVIRNNYVEIFDGIPCIIYNFKFMTMKEVLSWIKARA